MRYFTIVNFVAIISFIIPIIITSKNSFLLNNSLLILIVPFIFYAIFAAMISIVLFKDQIDQNSDAFMVSFNLKRTHIFITKLLLSFLVLLIYQLALSLIYFVLIASLDNQSNTLKSLLMSLSLGFGGIVIQLAFFSITTLISMVAAKAISLLFTIAIAVFLPLGSFFISPMLNARPQNIDGLDHPLYVANSSAMSEKEFNNLTNDQYYFNDYSTDIINKMQKYNEKNYYKYAAPYDIWYHANQLFNVFNDVNRFDNTIVQKWNINKEQLIAKFLLEGKDRKYIGFAIDKNEFKNKNYDYKQTVINTVSKINSYFMIGNNNAQDLFNDESNLAQRLLFVQTFIDSKQSGINDTLNGFLKNTNQTTASINTLLSINSVTPLIYKALLENNSSINNLPNSAITNFDDSTKQIGNFFMPGALINTLKPSPYFNIGWSIALFIGGSWLFISASWIIYSKKELV